MQSVLTRFNTFFESAPQALLPWRWVVLCGFFISTGIMLYGMLTHFSMDMSLESWFQDNDPVKTSLDELRSQFGSDDGIYIVYQTKDGDVFSEKSLRTLEALHQELDDARIARDASGELTGDLTRIARIDSLYNARYQIADGDTLISKKLIGNEFPQTDKARQRRREIALSQDGFKLAYYSKDFTYGGIRIKTDFGVVPKDDALIDTDVNNLLTMDDIDIDMQVDSDAVTTAIDYQDMQMEEYLNFMLALRAVTNQPKYQHLRFYYAGNAPVMEFALESMYQSTLLMGLMVLIVVGLLWFLFHSFSAVIWPIIVIAGSGIWTLGLASWLGVTLSTMASLTFMLILAVGVADCVHVLSAYSLYRRQQHAHRDAMRMAYRKTGLAILLTTITTMAGMLALTFADIPQIGVFGFTSALGVAMALILTMFVLPVLLDIWHPYNDKKVTAIIANNKKHWLQPLLDKIPAAVSRRPKIIVLVYVVFFVMFLYGTTKIKVDSNFTELTREGSDIRVTAHIIDNNMMGGQSMEFMLNFAQMDALKDPSVLKAIDQLQRHIEQTYPQFVVKTFSLADLVKETNKAMNQGQDSHYRIPDDQRLTAQLIYLFDNANPNDRRNLVNDSYSKSHITLQLRNAGSYEYTDFFTSVQQDIERIFAPLRLNYPSMGLNATGSLTLMMELIDHISWTQIKSFSLALLIITGLLMITLGSVQAGLISMIPNLLPAFFTFGLMGLIGIPLDTDTLVIAPLIIGIAVDDTIHFITHYRDAWFDSGDVDRALASTIKEVGQAVTFTTLILGIGFSVLAFSDYLGLAKTGIFGSLAIFVALSSDLLLMPALIKWFKPDLGRSKYVQKNLSQAATSLSAN